MRHYLDFEKPLAEIEGKAEELRALARQNDEMDVEAEAEALDKKAEIMLKDLYRILPLGESVKLRVILKGLIVSNT